MVCIPGFSGGSSLTHVSLTCKRRHVKCDEVCLYQNSSARYLKRTIRHNLSVDLVRKVIDHVFLRQLVCPVARNMVTQYSHR